MAATGFTDSDGNFKINEITKKKFDKDGYIIIRQLFDEEEMKLIKKALEESKEIAEHAYGFAWLKSGYMDDKNTVNSGARIISDGHGMKSKMVLWQHPGNDITGMVARCQKVVDTSEKLLGGEVYHYHSKVMMKEAKSGGAFVWHQDYGYWYKNGCLFPDILTMFVAVDKCTKDNGCLQVLRGSHLCGRIEHNLEEGQQRADIIRVEEIKKVCPLEYMEMNSGDALFTHSNLLHASDQNLSENRRWALLMAFNRASNNPVKVHHCPQYTPLVKVPNSAIKSCKSTDMSGKNFVDPKIDRTVKVDI